MNSVRQAEEVAELVCDVYKSTKGKLPPDLVGAIRYMLQQKERRKMVVVAFYDYLQGNCPKALKAFSGDQFEAVMTEKDMEGKFTKIEATWKAKREKGEVFDGKV